MRRRSPRIQKLIEEYIELREKMEANLKETIAIAQALVGVEVEIESTQAYDDNNYYSHNTCHQIGKTEVNLSFSDLDDVDMDLVAETIKRIKAAPESKEEILADIEEDKSSVIARVCIENSLNHEDVMEGLTQLLDVPGDFAHLLD